MTKVKFGGLLLLFQAIILILFVVFVDYGEEGTEGQAKKARGYRSKFPVFQDLHVMTFLGFTMIITFLKRYSRGMLVHALLIGGLVIQWATLLQGFFSIRKGKIDMSLERMIDADYAVIAILISFGALMGKCNSLQLLIVALFETFYFAINEAITLRILQVSDFGRSMVVHMFGAYFGLAVSRMIFSKKVCMSQALSMSNKSEMYAFIGTLFLWVYWPSINGSFPEGAAQNRAISNTYYALAASCVSAFSFTVLQSKEGKFNVLHLQNATIAGGVAIGAVAGMMLRPWGAVIVGIVSASVSVLGYKYLVPSFRRHLKIHDTRGIHVVHGLPGIVSGIASIIAAVLASENSYNLSLYDTYPARAPLENSTQFLELQKIMAQKKMVPFSPGLNRDAATQALYQLAGLGSSLGIAIFGGLLTGLVIKVKFFDPVSVGDAFDDHMDFEDANCIDLTSDHEFDDDDQEKHHDSIRGNKRLLDNDQHSDIVLTGFDLKKGSIANSIGKSDGSMYKGNHLDHISNTESKEKLSINDLPLEAMNKEEEEVSDQEKQTAVDLPDDTIVKENDVDIEMREMNNEEKPLLVLE